MAGEHVLITGGAGFIGSALAEALVRGGDRVRVLDALIPQIHGDEPERTSPTLRAVSAVAEVVVGDVTSRADLERALDGIDVVVHLAAETGTGQSMYRVAHYVDVNVGGTALLLDVLGGMRHSVRRIVVASSRAVYGEGRYRDAAGDLHNPPARTAQQLEERAFDPLDPRDGTPLVPVPTDEESRLSPTSIYGVTKLTQEQLVLTGAASLGISGVALRYQNVYGPGQALRNPYTGILSIFSTLIRRGERVNIFEDGLESRDFVFIDDVVDATVRAISAEGIDGLPINVGSGVATSVLTVVAQLERAFGRPADTWVSGNYRVGDIRHNVADLDRAQRLLGYTPRVDFATGIDRFVAWAAQQPDPDENYERSLDELRSRNLLK